MTSHLDKSIAGTSPSAVPFSKGTLRRALLSGAENAPAERRSLILGGQIRDARQSLLDTLIPTDIKGDLFARKLSQLSDEAIVGLFQASAMGAKHITDNMAVVAVGGYGRAHLAPYSDVDLLFLHSSGVSKSMREVLDPILYSLFDTGVSIAQAVHTPQSAAAFIKEDMTGRTSFLDARFICGNEKLMADFVRRYDNLRKSSISEFVKAKLDERQARYTTANDSRYLVEPDVKEGKGGLRDIHLLHWLMRYTTGLDDAPSLNLAHRFLGDEAKQYQKAISFLWSVRVQMHAIRGRAEEKLTFDIQPLVAERLGYQNRGRSLAVERFMKHYFLNVREVGRVTGVVSAMLEEANVKETRQLRDWFPMLGAGRKKALQPKTVMPNGVNVNELNFALKGERLDFKDHATASKTPKDLFRLFQIAGLNPARDIHPSALQAVRTGARFLNRDVRNDPEIADIFADFIINSTGLEKPLRHMSETDLLGKYIRSFGLLVGETQYGLFRRFTLDEHVLKAVGQVSRLCLGIEADIYPISTGILGRLDDPLSYYMTIMLNETGAALRKAETAKIEAKVKRAIKRFAQLESKKEIIAQVAASPYYMMRTAKLRNPLSPSLVSHFAEQIGSIEVLNHYVVLSAVYARVAGVNSWDRMAGRDITILYEATVAWLEGGADGLSSLISKFVSTRESETVPMLKTWSKSQQNDFFARLTPGFWVGLSPASAAKLAIAAQGVDDAKDRGATIVGINADNQLEVITYTADRQGLFSDIAGAVSASRGSVNAAYAFPIKAVNDGQPMAVNSFVLDLDKNTNVAELTAKLEQEIGIILTEGRSPDYQITKKFGDRRSVFDVETFVGIDQNSSGSCTVVDTVGRDCAGLLYQLTKALTQFDIVIQSAYVSTAGERAENSFYIQDAKGDKINDGALLRDISDRLYRVLGNLQDSD